MSRQNNHPLIITPLSYSHSQQHSTNPIKSLHPLTSSIPFLKNTITIIKINEKLTKYTSITIAFRSITHLHVTNIVINQINSTHQQRKDIGLPCSVIKSNYQRTRSTYNGTRTIQIRIRSF